MADMIGIHPWHTGDIAGELKRAALLCDKLLVKHVHGESECRKFPSVLADLEYLKMHGIVIDAPPHLAYDTARHPWLATLDPLILDNPWQLVKNELMKILSEPDTLRRIKDFEEETLEKAADAYARVAASVLSDDDSVPAIPFLRGGLGEVDGMPTRRTKIVRAVYDQIPMPDADTPWEAIKDWRADSHARAQFNRLRLWISRSSESSLSIATIKEELEVSLDEYSSYMERQHARITKGRFEALCRASLEFLESLPSIRVSPLLKAIFKPEILDAALGPGEDDSTAPGREVAYIVRTRRLRANSTGGLG